MTNNSVKHQSFVYTPLNDQTVLFQKSQFNISHSFAINLNLKQVYLIHRYDPIRCCTPSPSEPGSDGNEVVLCITQSSSISGASPSAGLVSYTHWGGVLLLCRDAVGVSYRSSRLGLVGSVLTLCRDAVGVYNRLSSMGLIGSVLPLCGDAVSESYRSSSMGLIGSVLPLCRDAVSVFYSHSRLGLIFSKSF